MLTFTSRFERTRPHGVFRVDVSSVDILKVLNRYKVRYVWETVISESQWCLLLQHVDYTQLYTNPTL
jgi:hypothetical protein